MRTFLFNYWFEGDRYSVEVDAADETEAKRRLSQMTKAVFDGELFVRLRVPGGGWLRRLFGVH